jgi:hypothetical protein
MKQICFFGMQGAGKTAMGKVIPRYNKKIIAHDASGVGRYRCTKTQNVLVMEDITQDHILDKQNRTAIFQSASNDGQEIKIHSETIIQNPKWVLMTTNEDMWSLLEETTNDIVGKGYSPEEQSKMIGLKGLERRFHWLKLSEQKELQTLHFSEKYTRIYFASRVLEYCMEEFETFRTICQQQTNIIDYMGILVEMLFEQQVAEILDQESRDFWQAVLSQARAKRELSNQETIQQDKIKLEAQKIKMRAILKQPELPIAAPKPIKKRKVAEPIIQDEPPPKKKMVEEDEEEEYPDSDDSYEKH